MSQRNEREETELGNISEFTGELCDAVSRWLEDNTYSSSSNLPVHCTRKELRLFLTIQRVIDESRQADVNFKKTIGMSLEGIKDPRIKGAIARWFHRVWIGGWGECLRRSDACAWCLNTRLLYTFIAQYVVLDDSWHRIALACSTIDGVEWADLITWVDSSTEAARQNTAGLRRLVRIDEPEAKSQSSDDR